MHVKYYGTTDNSGANLIFTLMLVDPYKRTPPLPSYCVWIVPGTIDVDGNPID